LNFGIGHDIICALDPGIALPTRVRRGTGGEMTKIVLDAMGGDLAPKAPIEGAIWAARELGVEVILVGREEVVRAELELLDGSDLPISVVHASQVIETDDQPATAVRAKADSSIVVGMDLVGAGQADGFVSAGNSGGVLAAALFRLGRIPGVQRPALSTVYPTVDAKVLLLDVGANTDCKPEYLLQFAIMGSAHARLVLGIEDPRVGLVSTGEEEGKGSVLSKGAYALIKNSNLNFVGNIEGKDLPMGLADVVVTDGFTGNVILKTSEGVAQMLLTVMKQEIKRRTLAKAGALLVKRALKEMDSRLDYAEYGGVPLLGVAGIAIVAHGRSNARAIKNAIKVAQRSAESDLIAAIQEGIGG